MGTEFEGISVVDNADTKKLCGRRLGKAIGFTFKNGGYYLYHSTIDQINWPRDGFPVVPGGPLGS